MKFKKKTNYILAKHASDSGLDQENPQVTCVFSLAMIDPY
jgi:hypothetical protein